MSDIGESSGLNKINTITLTSADGKLFEVDEAVAMELVIVKNFFDNNDISYNTVVPLPNVTSTSLMKIINYCKKQLEFRLKYSNNDKNKKDEELKAFEEEFVKGEDKETLIDLLLDANYLNVKDLLEFLCRVVADLIKDIRVEEAREFFGIQNDFTPEEEREIRDKDSWAFD